MKRIIAFIFLPAMAVLLSCGNDNSKTTDPASPANETADAAKQSPSTGTGQEEGIVGEWEMQGFVLDTNDNLQIDEEERKNLKPASFKDYMKLNADGSGLFTVAKMEGRYEVKAEDGKKFLTWFDQANGSHRIGTIQKRRKTNCILRSRAVPECLSGKGSDTKPLPGLIMTRPSRSPKPIGIRLIYQWPYRKIAST